MFHLTYDIIIPNIYSNNNNDNNNDDSGLYFFIFFCYLQTYYLHITIQAVVCLRMKSLMSALKVTCQS